MQFLLYTALWGKKETKQTRKHKTTKLHTASGNIYTVAYETGSKKEKL